MEFATLREKIAHEKQARQQRYRCYFAAFEAAYDAAYKAARAHTPVPMHLSTGETIPGGPCGFAWLTSPGNTSLGRWLKKEAGWKKGYRGLTQYCPLGTQSMSTKEAWCKAFADSYNATLEAAGLADRIGYSSRID